MQNKKRSYTVTSYFDPAEDITFICKEDPDLGTSPCDNKDKEKQASY